jgi:hypothetical protein
MTGSGQVPTDAPAHWSRNTVVEMPICVCFSRPFDDPAPHFDRNQPKARRWNPPGRRRFLPEPEITTWFRVSPFDRVDKRRTGKQVQERIMLIRKAILGMILASATVSAGIPATAFARDHDRHGYHDDHRRYAGHGDYRNDRGYRGDRGYRCRKSGGTTGLLLGGAGGALVGRSIDTRGDRTTGTVLGLAAGALAGRAIDRNSRC